VICAGILCTTIFEKFTHGAWLTVLITGFVIATGCAIRRHYRVVSGQFKNFVFVSVGEIDSEAFHGEEMLAELRDEVEDNLESYVNYCRRHGWAAASMHGFGTDVVERLLALSEVIVRQYPNSMFFAAQLIFQEDHALTRLLHNQTAYAIQRDLHLQGVPMVILPMKI
jgi:hypothetical protein